MHLERTDESATEHSETIWYLINGQCEEALKASEEFHGQQSSIIRACALAVVT